MLPKQDPLRSMQHVLVDLRYEKAYIFNNLIKCNFCNFTLLMPRAVAPFAPPPLHATGEVSARGNWNPREVQQPFRPNPKRGR